MEIDLPNLEPAARYRFLTHVVVPRPIAWVTSLSAEGALNAAPFSFFNVFGSKPPLVVLGIGNRPDSDEPKDTVKNIRTTGEFVINTVSRAQAEQMVATSAPLAHGVSELDGAGLQVAPSKKVAPPRILGAPATLECRVHSVQEIGGNRLIVGTVVHAAIDDDCYDAKTGQVLTEKMAVVGRMHGPAGYCGTDDSFEIERPR